MTNDQHVNSGYEQSAPTRIINLIKSPRQFISDTQQCCDNDNVWKEDEVLVLDEHELALTALPSSNPMEAYYPKNTG